MNDLEKKLESLYKQQEQAKELYVKCQGAIELIKSLLEEEVSNKEDSKKNKDKK